MYFRFSVWEMAQTKFKDDFYHISIAKSQISNYCKLLTIRSRVFDIYMLYLTPVLCMGFLKIVIGID